MQIKDVVVSGLALHASIGPNVTQTETSTVISAVTRSAIKKRDGERDPEQRSGNVMANVIRAEKRSEARIGPPGVIRAQGKATSCDDVGNYGLWGPPEQTAALPAAAQWEASLVRSMQPSASPAPAQRPPSDRPATAQELPGDCPGTARDYPGTTPDSRNPADLHHRLRQSAPYEASPAFKTGEA